MREPRSISAATTAPVYDGPGKELVGLIGRALRGLDAVPYALLAIPLRLAVANVFWSSGTTKLANWDATLDLFENEYKVPLFPVDVAATLGASIELSTPVLLVLGLLTRPAAALLLGMTLFIEIFVYPQAWPTHIQWAAMILVLLCRGAGPLSLDYFVRRYFLGGSAPRT
jgi:putative oxidoreductase